MVLGPPRVYLHPGFFDAATCRRVRAAMHAAPAEPAEILDTDIVLDDAARRASSVDVDTETLALVEAAIESARDELAAFFGESLAEREGPGFLRYGPGDFYGPHRDRGLVPSWPGAARRTIAVVIFLNDGFSGGVLRLLGDEETSDIVPRAGTLAAFPAITLHEVAPLVDGIRETVVDWFY